MTSKATTPLSIGKVTLVVHDLERVRTFYEQAIGLHLLSADAVSAALGVGSTTLLELRRDQTAKSRSPRDAGLFHTAFLLPSRSDLGCWTKHAGEKRLPLLGASDHGVSEALYLADPEGNGIELYADRPSETWKRTGLGVDMPSDPLDIDNLIESADAQPWQGAPEGLTIGHVHLQVGAISPAEEFYAGALGLDITHRYPGASFYSSGGYHHHIATNIWNSRGAAVRNELTTGLADIEIVASDPEILNAVRVRVPAPRLVQNNPSRLSLRDPWGTSITLVPR